MFNRILIANRGEIACRIIKTAKKMGIHTIAVYSTADSDSEHVKRADSAFCIGEASASESYLNIEAVIAAAKKGQADAIHPGYGFLSENPKLAEACKKEAICFIGPSIEAMQAMASKQLAKQLLEKTSVPLTPGYHGRDQSDERLIKEAKEIGFPVLLKAASGGGGKGMRSVFKEEDLQASIEAARREAKASFSDDTLIIEKLITHPRHIEIQVIADKQGHVLHLFERDCSIQRRHQKIIEEAPAPNLSPELRQKLAEAACEVALSIGYQGAGTVEFLMGSDQNFYFMEMNTRLQVEHPVTEMITGLDLVELQIRIASGTALPYKQKDIEHHGHAIECRIYAEDPQKQFMPSTGLIHFLREPEGKGIRIDSGIKQGSEITIYYDPMIAKLIAWGEDRTEALKRLQSALKHYFIGGVKTNISYLQSIIENEAFIKAKLSTHFLEEEPIRSVNLDIKKALQLAAAYDYLTLQRKTDEPVINDNFGWHLNLNAPYQRSFFIDDEQFQLNITPISREEFEITFASKRTQCKTSQEQNRIFLEIDKEHFCGEVIEWEQKIHVFHPDGYRIITPYSWERKDALAGPQKGQLTSPMPATVVAVLKNIGEAVKTGERLMVLEAMKMEHTIHAPSDGILTELFYNVGAQVNEGAELLALEDIDIPQDS